jgi:hypothetical protein
VSRPRLTPGDERDTQVISLRLPPAVHAALVREAARRSEAAGGVPVSPAAVVRRIVEVALAAVDAAPASPPPAPPATPEPTQPPAPPPAPEPSATIPEPTQPQPSTSTAAAPQRRASDREAAARAADHDALRARVHAAKAAGHSMRELARAANVVPSVLSMFANGTRAGVADDTAAALASALANMGY